MTIDEARVNIGNKVIYYVGFPHKEGVITSVNEIYVHVRYGSDVGSKATRPEDLELLAR